MTEPTTPLASLTDEGLDALLKRAMRNALILGGISAAVVAFAAGWRSAAMLAVGAAISTFSVLEWKRLIHVINARFNNQQSPKSAASVAIFFVLRLTIYAGVVYGSLKCFKGSAVALLCGLALSLITLAFEALRLLKD